MSENKNEPKTVELYYDEAMDLVVVLDDTVRFHFRCIGHGRAIPDVAGEDFDYEVVASAVNPTVSVHLSELNTPNRLMAFTVSFTK